MVVEKKLVEKELDLLSAETGFKKGLLVKDYHITLLLYILRDVKSIYFKGGTALQKTILNHARISEDIDFTLTRPLSEVRRDIENVVGRSGLFGSITRDKDVEGFVRLVVPYHSELGEGVVNIDLNERGKLLQKPDFYMIRHFYRENIPAFSFPCLSKEEMIAEKIAAAIGRNKPRDHYDIYQIIKAKLPINMTLVKKKCEQSHHDPSIIKMFNQAKKLHKRWQEDLEPLLIEEVAFQTVMQTLAKHFNLKEAKEAKKDK